MGVSWNKWFIMENSLLKWMIWENPPFKETPTCIHLKLKDDFFPQPKPAATLPTTQKKTFHPKDHWTLKTGYFEDLPLLYRFVHPSIGGSKILRARIFLRSPDSKLWLGSWGVWPFCTMTSSLRRFLFLVLFELRVSGWIYTTVSVPHLPIEKIIPPNNARPVFYCFGRMIMKSLDTTYLDDRMWNVWISILNLNSSQ